MKTDLSGYYAAKPIPLPFLNIFLWETAKICLTVGIGMILVILILKYILKKNENLMADEEKINIILKIGITVVGLGLFLVLMVRFVLPS